MPLGPNDPLPLKEPGGPNPDGGVPKPPAGGSKPPPAGGAKPEGGVVPTAGGLRSDDGGLEPTGGVKPAGGERLVGGLAPPGVGVLELEPPAVELQRVPRKQSHVRSYSKRTLAEQDCRGSEIQRVLGLTFPRKRKILSLK